MRKFLSNVTIFSSKYEQWLKSTKFLEWKCEFLAQSMYLFQKLSPYIADENPTEHTIGRKDGQSQ